jgi:hypothetical protein
MNWPAPRVRPAGGVIAPPTPYQAPAPVFVPTSVQGVPVPLMAVAMAQAAAVNEMRSLQDTISEVAESVRKKSCSFTVVSHLDEAWRSVEYAIAAVPE